MYTITEEVLMHQTKNKTGGEHMYVPLYWKSRKRAHVHARTQRHRVLMVVRYLSEQGELEFTHTGSFLFGFNANNNC